MTVTVELLSLAFSLTWPLSTHYNPWTTGKTLGFQSPEIYLKYCSHFWLFEVSFKYAKIFNKSYSIPSSSSQFLIWLGGGDLAPVSSTCFQLAQPQSWTAAGRFNYLTLQLIPPTSPTSLCDTDGQEESIWLRCGRVLCVEADKQANGT